MAVLGHIAVYGNVRILRVECPDCKRLALVLDGRMACCDTKVTGVIASLENRISEAAAKRKKPPPRDQKAILAAQENKCLYCDRQLGSIVYRGWKLVRLRIHWDHMTPYVYSRNNQETNFAAACHVCNFLKSSLMFEDVERARVYLNEAWQRKGYSSSADVSKVQTEVPAETRVAKVLQAVLQDSTLASDKLRKDTKRWVSKGFRREVWQQVNRKSIPASEKITCLHCHAKFKPVRSWQQFCSPECRTKRWDLLHPRVVAQDKL